MSYKIVIDSCGELLEGWKEDSHFESVPLVLTVGEEEIVDDETFVQKKFLEKVAACPTCPKSACPSPDRYLQAYDCDAKDIYVVTLSAELSGSYNSAQLGRELYLEDHPKKNIYVFNSRSASCGETLIAMKIKECADAGMAFADVVETVEAYMESQNIFFVLENLETLRKNGRLSKVKSLVATALKIKPVMGATPEGNICQLNQARGMNRALVKLVDYVADSVKGKDTKERVVAISHCNCAERAQMIKEAIAERMQVKDVLVLDTAGVSSMYANDGGVIVCL